MRTLCCAVVMLLAAATTARSQSMTPDAALKEFVPVDELQLEADEGLSVCSEVWASDPAGQPLRVAAMYLSPTGGVFRVLGRDSAALPFGLVGESAPQASFIGFNCELEVRDLDGDGASDVYVLVSQPSYDAAWIFRWSAGTLVNATPVEGDDEASYSRLSFPSEVDLWHDGRRQFYAAEGPSVDGTPSEGVLFEWSAGSLTASQELRDMWYVRRGALTLSVHELRGGGGSGNYVLRFVNGQAGGAHRVDVSSVRVGGREIVGAGVLTTKVEFLEVPLGQVVPAGSVVEVLSSSSDPAARLIATLLERNPVVSPAAIRRDEGSETSRRSHGGQQPR
jgi:hypothetical protein